MSRLPASKLSHRRPGREVIATRRLAALKRLLKYHGAFDLNIAPDIPYHARTAYNSLMRSLGQPKLGLGAP